MDSIRCLRWMANSGKQLFSECHVPQCILEDITPKNAVHDALQELPFTGRTGRPIKCFYKCVKKHFSQLLGRWEVDTMSIRLDLVVLPTNSAWPLACIKEQHSL